jgi:hypothetical protein
MSVPHPVLPQLEQQLVRAAQARSHAEHERRAPSSRRWWRPSRVGRRAGALSLACLLVAATALAATHPWTPLLGNDSLGHATTSRQAPPAEQLATFGVLRTPQTDADRGENVEAALQFFGRQAHGVRVDFIRKLGDGPRGTAILLIPMQSFGLASTMERPIDDDLCVFYPGEQGGGAVSCWTTDQLREQHTSGSLWDTAGGHLYGLVPDGVSQVVWHRADATAVTAEVHDNFFDFSASSAMSGAPDLEWHGPSGAIVMPAG